MFGKGLDLDRGIFSVLSEDQMYTKWSLNTHMANLLKTQSKMIEHHGQVIQKGDQVHTSEKETTKYTVFAVGNQKIGCIPGS